jgi:hypothetical protein
MGLPHLPFSRYIPSRQLILGSDMNALFDMFTSFAGGLIALAGGGLSAKTPIFNAAYNEVDTVATAADSYALPPAKVGLCVTVTNSGAASMTVFGSGTDTVSGAASQAHAVGATIDYVCRKNGVWVRYTAS